MEVHKDEKNRVVKKVRSENNEQDSTKEKI